MSYIRNHPVEVLKIDCTDWEHSNEHKTIKDIMENMKIKALELCITVAIG